MSTGEMAEKTAWNSKSTWGPLFWQLGHLVSFAYPEHAPSAEQREQTARFYESLASVVPCEECKTDYAAILAVNPVRPHLGNRDALSRWFYGVHNQVNAKLGKPVTLSYEQVKQRYLACQSQQQAVQSCQRSLGSQRVFIALLSIALVALVLYLIVSSKSKASGQ